MGSQSNLVTLVSAWLPGSWKLTESLLGEGPKPTEWRYYSKRSFSKRVSRSGISRHCPDSPDPLVLWGLSRISGFSS